MRVKRGLSVDLYHVEEDLGRWARTTALEAREQVTFPTKNGLQSKNGLGAIRPLAIIGGTEHFTPRTTVERLLSLEDSLRSPRQGSLVEGVMSLLDQQSSASVTTPTNPPKRHSSGYSLDELER